MSGIVGSLQQPCDKGVMEAQRDRLPASRASQPWVLAATIIASSLAFIDGTVTNLILPALQKELGATLADVQWVVEAYALVVAALMLVGGSLGDRLGRKRVFLAGIVIFALGSLWCGLSPSVLSLIAARTLQGVGSILITPNSLAILSSAFDDEDRGRAIGTWSGSTAIFAALGPLLGGYLIQHVSWRWVFFINIPLAAAALWLTIVHLRDTLGAASKHLDIAGAALCTLGLGGIVFALIQATTTSLGDPLVLWSGVGGVLALVAFVLVEARSPDPMMPLELFRNSVFAGVNILTLLLYGGLGGALFFVPFDLMQVHGYTPFAAGASLLPFIVIMSLLSRWSGGLITRVGAKLPLVVGPLLAGAGLAMFGIAGLGGSYWTTFFPAIVVLGLGMAIAVAPLTTVVMTAAGQENAGVASGINNAVSRVASLLAVAALSLVLWGVFNHQLDSKMAGMTIPAKERSEFNAERIKLAAAAPPASLPASVRDELETALKEAYVAGFRTVMFVGGLLAFAGAFAIVLMVPGKRKETSGAKAPALQAPAR